MIRSSHRLAAKRAVEHKERELEWHAVQRATRLPARLVFEVVAHDGQEELERPVNSLIWSGLAGGIMITFSLIGMAILRVHLPDVSWRPLVEYFGYSFGFLLVVLGRLQLFTENTITTVVPVYANPTRENLSHMMLLWGVVLGANIFGAAITTAFLTFTSVFGADMHQAMADISLHATEHAPFDAFIKAIPAGVLIAAIVWILPTTTNGFWVVMLFTYLIALCGFTHVVAGSAEVTYLIWNNQLSIWNGFSGFIVPVLIGNVVGGTAIFSFAIWSQIRLETKIPTATTKDDVAAADE